MSKFRDIKTCNVTSGTVIIWGAGPNFSDGPVSYKCTELYPGHTAGRQLGASMWCEMPKLPTQAALKRPKGYTEAFVAVWSKYPRTAGTSKADALRAWNRLTDDEQEQVRRALPIFVQSCRGTDERYIRHMASWLNGKFFETIGQPITVPAATLFDQPAIPPETYRRAVALYEKTGNWNHQLGPEPRAR